MEKEKKSKKWYATWKFAVLVVLVILLLVWILLPDDFLGAATSTNF